MIDDAQEHSTFWRPKRWVKVARDAQLPDRLRLARFAKMPEYGPRVLFFSGGTALNSLSRRLINYTHNSIHMITPFDSGGSSARLRKAFGLLGVGDFRSRLMAMADHSVKGHQAVYELLQHRLPKDAEPRDLHRRLERMAASEDPLVKPILKPLKPLILNQLRFFLDEMPPYFDLRGASIGNLLLVGGWLNNANDIESVIFMFSQLVEVRGTVLPVVTESLHLQATLEDGTTLTGQHTITGKEVPPIASPVKSLEIVRSLDHPEPVTPVIDERRRRMISKADVICYPVGSFYTSLIANLLPAGVSDALAARSCPKVYVPNTGSDPEQLGRSLADRVDILLQYLRRGCSDSRACDTDFLNAVFVDEAMASQLEDDELRRITLRGIAVIDLPLITEQSHPRLDDDRMLAALLSLV